MITPTKLRRPAKKLKPTVPAAVIRKRYAWLKKMVIGLVSIFAINWALGLVFLPSHVIVFLMLPFFVVYVLFCVAFGRLANCFGESTSSWAMSAFFFNIYVLVLGYFAFSEEVIKAHAESV